jgi:hypothetical protein
MALDVHVARIGSAGRRASRALYLPIAEHGPRLGSRLVPLPKPSRIAPNPAVSAGGSDTRPTPENPGNAGDLAASANSRVKRALSHLATRPEGRFYWAATDAGLTGSVADGEAGVPAGGYSPLPGELGSGGPLPHSAMT